MYIQRYGILAQTQGAAPFVPTDIANCVAWYDDYVNGGTLRTTLANGASINQWDDLTGSYNMNVKVGQPTYLTTGDLINCASGKALGRTASGPIIGNMISTVFCIVKMQANYDGYVWFIGDNQYYTLNNRTSTIYYQSTNSGTGIYNDSEIGNGNRVLYTSVFSTNAFNAAVMRRNAVLQTATTLGGTGTNTSITGRICVGGYCSAGTITSYTANKSHGYQALIVYNRALNSTEIGQVESYLNTKYTIY